MHRFARILPLTLFLLVAPADASAQFRVGGGLSLSELFGDDVGENDTRSGLALGASAGLFSIGPARILAEVHYRQKGAEDVMEAEQLIAAGEAVEFGLDYVEVPLLVRFNLPPFGGRVVPYIHGGPVFGWQVDCGVRVTAEGGEEACEDLSGANLEETLRDYEQGLTFGGGFDVVVLRGLGAISLEGRYIRGLSRLSQEGEVKNQGYALTLGYSFGLPESFPGVEVR